MYAQCRQNAGDGLLLGLFDCGHKVFDFFITKSFKGREVLNAFKREYSKKPLAQRKTHVVFLNWKGELLYAVKKAKSPGKFAQYMKLALKKNTKALAEAKVTEGKASAKR